MRSVFILGCWVIATGIALAAIVGGLSKEHTTTISGKVTAACSTLRARPVPQVLTVGGATLSGDPWLGDGLGSSDGTCVSAFLIENVKPLDSYRVAVGAMSATVSRAGTMNVELVER